MERLKPHLDLIQNSQYDAILLTSLVNRRYAAGYNISDGMAILSPEGCRYFTDSRYIEEAQKNLPGFEVLMTDREHTYTARLQEAIADWNIKSLAFEENHMSAGRLRELEKELPVTFITAHSDLSAFRMVKEDWELELMKKAQEITDKTFSDLLNVIHPGMTEKELHRKLLCRLYENGADAPSFGPIVISGPNTSLPHGVASERVLQDGDFVTLDFGAKFGGYCSDMTRTVALGSVTDEMQTVYNTVLDAQLSGIAVTKAGIRGCDVDAAARKVISDAGYGEYFGHSYGHGIGLEVHEGPNCSPSYEKELPIGCVCSAEPGIYLPGKFGVRIEDMVIIRENSCENLTKSTKSLIIL